MNSHCTVICPFFSFLFGIVSVVCLLRFLCQLSGVDPHNRVVAPIVRMTDHFLRPIRRALPVSRNVDMASVAIAWLAMSVRHLLLISQSGVQLEAVLHSAWLGVIVLLQYAIWIYVIAIVATVIISWVAPMSSSPYVALARQLPAPLLGPIQRLIPSLGGLDFSPAIVLVGLMLTNSRVIPWLHTLIG